MSCHVYLQSYGLSLAYRTAAGLCPGEGNLVDAHRAGGLPCSAAQGAVLAFLEGQGG